MAEEKNQYSIGKVSTLCNVPVRTLRYYDKIGLLVPSHRKDDNHYRYYSQEQLLTLFIIPALYSVFVNRSQRKEKEKLARLAAAHQACSH